LDPDAWNWQPLNRGGARKESRRKGRESVHGVTPKAGLANFTPLRTA
jgi:hypothetical protein